MTIPAGATTADIDVAVLDDALVEGDGDGDPDAGDDQRGPGDHARHAATASLDIADNDTATVSIAKTTDGAETGPVNGGLHGDADGGQFDGHGAEYTVGGTAASGVDLHGLERDGDDPGRGDDGHDRGAGAGRRRWWKATETVSLTLATISGDPQITLGTPDHGQRWTSLTTTRPRSVDRQDDGRGRDGSGERRSSR